MIKESDNIICDYLMAYSCKACSKNIKQASAGVYLFAANGPPSRALNLKLVFIKNLRNCF